ncbi:hypothetical protein N8Z80_02910 [Litorivicinus sp.]|nr:hypothetical protein [Litorivicinus sp.]MDC1239968.1 hypothetical protein [Litorivicinus sp.]
MENRVKFLERLNISLDYAGRVYQHYLVNDKKFVYAKILFEVNTEISVLVRDGVKLLPTDLRVDAFELMFHIDVWRNIWLDECGRQKPSWDDTFIFPTLVSFPKKSVQNLLESGLVADEKANMLS